MEEFYIISIALVFTLLISWALAEFFGRAKHIGFGWTFALSATTVFIGGIIALIASPSAKEEPTSGGKGYQIGAWVCFIFGALNTIMLNPLAIGFFVSGAYLWKLSNAEIVNTSTKFFINNNILKPVNTNNAKIITSKNNAELQKEEVSYDQRIQNLVNLKNKGLLTYMEYEEKRLNILSSQQNMEVLQSEEYQQLDDLLGAGLLTQQEFGEKVEKLKTHFIKSKSSNQNRDDDDNVNKYESIATTFKGGMLDKKKDENKDGSLEALRVIFVILIVVGMIILLFLFG